jgi:oligopeptide/dipeptide ABC transporter ATP-binding protein
MTDKLLEIDNLHTHFQLEEGVVQAVNGVSLDIYPGETVGIVGESGCGKSVLARSILRIVPPPGQIVEGHVTYYQPKHDPIELTALDPTGKEIRDIRGADISMVFQEPMASFSPVHTIGNQIGEAIQLHQFVDRDQARQLTLEILQKVGMPNPERNIDRYTFQLSGGMRQRAMIAMALSCRPNLLISDEPTTALDVTTQAQILRLMMELQQEFNMAILFITHDLGVVAQMTDRVFVMYLGEVVESADVVTLFYEPKHPYTKALLRSIPQVGKFEEGKRLKAIHGSVPSPYARPKGCPFHTRCEQAIRGVCDTKSPPVVKISENHQVKCVLYE